MRQVGVREERCSAVFDTQGRTEDAKKSTQPLPFIPEIKKEGRLVGQTDCSIRRHSQTLTDTHRHSQTLTDTHKHTGNSF